MKFKKYAFLILVSFGIVVSKGFALYESEKPISGISGADCIDLIFSMLENMPFEYKKSNIRCCFDQVIDEAKRGRNYAIKKMCKELLGVALRGEEETFQAFLEVIRSDESFMKYNDVIVNYVDKYYSLRRGKYVILGTVREYAAQNEKMASLLFQHDLLCSVNKCKNLRDIANISRK